NRNDVILPGLEARILSAKAEAYYHLGQQECIYMSWEAGLMAFIAGAISHPGDELPTLLAGDVYLSNAWKEGKREKRNPEGFAVDGQWFWHCYQCHSCDHNGEDVRDSECGACRLKHAETGLADQY